jgi:hypothetical protein
VQHLPVTYTIEPPPVNANRLQLAVPLPRLNVVASLSPPLSKIRDVLLLRRRMQGSPQQQPQQQQLSPQLFRGSFKSPVQPLNFARGAATCSWVCARMHASVCVCGCDTHEALVDGWCCCNLGGCL